ncbi:uncharacterized protein LOC115891833 [Sitophilus oryzae]|uniref:Uncharacterized protein LOC115891833 n=1 Tax=Sitophilus oryzae TaxID=7048 RepID=A0A6J2YYF1_SITOR|nr:uncharacterized protein LOC115891833 [Sitophilus oryzae]
MTHHLTGYDQDYATDYYQNNNVANYDGMYYDPQDTGIGNGNLVDSNEGLEEPTSRLYAEGYPDIQPNQYHEETVDYGITNKQQIPEVSVNHYEPPIVQQSRNYYYDVPRQYSRHHHHHHHSKKHKSYQLQYQNQNQSYNQHPNHHSLYTQCPLVNQEQNYNQPEYLEGYDASYGDYVNQTKQSEYYGAYYGDSRVRNVATGYYVQGKGMKTGSRKYPVTVKTPKYITKKLVSTPLNKKPSALCLAVGTQPDPALLKRKSKTHHTVKKVYDRAEESFQVSAPQENANFSYSAHQMDSEGDLNRKPMPNNLENSFNQYPVQGNIVSNVENSFNQYPVQGNLPNHLENSFKQYQVQENISNSVENSYNQYPAQENITSNLENSFTKYPVQENVSRENLEETDGQENIKAFAKFLKPRVPSSIKAKQERIAQMKSSLNMAGGVPLQPKMKISLDKLLNRLQKCEDQDQKNGNNEKTSETLSQSKKDGKTKKISKLDSFNYESLSQKGALSSKNPDDVNKGVRKKYSSTLELKNSLRFMKPLDDNCALDLHRSKSYIVDLIDKALSRELGTVPREQLLHQNMTPKKAIEAISRHHQPDSKDLSFEVTAALTDSFISNVTAPPSNENNEARILLQDPRQVQSDDETKKKVCNPNYIKQLKQLRWGHIRHIQHEARKLADLEEFLENCGESDF